MRFSKLLLALGLTLAASSCTVGYTTRATTTTTVSRPSLVEIQPGVWVVAEYDRPVFYSDGLYWRYDGSYWYRSTYVGGWNRVGVGVVPRAVVTIDRPTRYRNYRVRRGATVRAVPANHWRRGRGTTVRTNRSRGTTVRTNRSRGTTVRTNRSRGTTVRTNRSRRGTTVRTNRNRGRGTTVRTNRDRGRGTTTRRDRDRGRGTTTRRGERSTTVRVR